MSSGGGVLLVTYKYFLFHSLMAIIVATLSHNKASMFSKAQFNIKAEKNKAFGHSCLFATFNIKSGNIAECLERCLENCRCQSFQICESTKCQLCFSHKEANASLLHDKNGCVYAVYETRILTGNLQVCNHIWLKCNY